MHTRGFRLPVGMHDSQRQSHPKRGASSLSSACCVYGPTVQLHQIAHNREPEAEPGMLSGSRAVGLAETLEDVRQKIGLDADARIADNDFDAGVDALEPHLNAPLL